MDLLGRIDHMLTDGVHFECLLPDALIGVGDGFRKRHALLLPEHGKGLLHISGCDTAHELQLQAVPVLRLDVIGQDGLPRCVGAGKGVQKGHWEKVGGSPHLSIFTVEELKKPGFRWSKIGLGYLRYLEKIP